MACLAIVFCIKSDPKLRIIMYGGEVRGTVDIYA